MGLHQLNSLLDGVLVIGIDDENAARIVDPVITGNPDGGCRVGNMLDTHINLHNAVLYLNQAPTHCPDSSFFIIHFPLLL